MVLVEIKDFNALINNKPIFDQPAKKKKKERERMKALLKCQETMIMLKEIDQITRIIKVIINFIINVL